MANAAAEGAGKESVNKIAAVIGGVFPFFGAKRQAVTTYINDIQNSNLSPEAKMMSIANAKKTYKQLKNQCTIAHIAQDAAKESADFSASSGVDDEWLERFMDSTKFVSDEEVQTLWGNVLAKEFETPNSTPPSVIRILTEITPTYAKAFQVLCSLGILIAEVGADGKIVSWEYAVRVGLRPYLVDGDELMAITNLSEYTFPYFTPGVDSSAYFFRSSLN